MANNSDCPNKSGYYPSPYDSNSNDTVSPDDTTSNHNASSYICGSPNHQQTDLKNSYDPPSNDDGANPSASNSRPSDNHVSNFYNSFVESDANSYHHNTSSPHSTKRHE
ncbi:unnamed protein product [Aphanomyces euteiches]